MEVMEPFQNLTKVMGPALQKDHCVHTHKILLTISRGSWKCSSLLLDLWIRTLSFHN